MKGVLGIHVMLFHSERCVGHTCNVVSINLFFGAQIMIGFTHLFMFVSVEELDSPAYPDDFQEVEVKVESMEYDAVSFDLFCHISLMLM